jgi:hypothetical protein
MTLRIRSRLRTGAAAARGMFLVATRGRPTADGPYKIFVVGSGRSGTHWLGYILDAFPATHVTVEKAPIFPWVVDIAQNPGRERDLFPRLARRYRAEHRAVLPRHYVDKSHPNLWLAESLAAEFPEARFVAISRRLEGTVASMLKHDGVRHWAEAWDRDPRPNRFLGVDEALVATYREMSIAARCAVRVIAHAREIERLGPVLGPRLHKIGYETLHAEWEAEVARLSAFLGLAAPAGLPTPKAESRDKWRSGLADGDRRDIRSVAALMGAGGLLEPAEAV